MHCFSRLINKPDLQERQQQKIGPQHRLTRRPIVTLMSRAFMSRPYFGVQLIQGLYAYVTSVKCLLFQE